MEEALAWKTGLVAAWFALLVFAERLAARAPWPREPERRRARLAGNGGFWLVGLIVSAAVTVPITVFAAAHAPAWRENWPQGWVGFAIDFLLLDAFLYLWHRANHEIPFLWRFHEVHHLDPMLDATSAIRFHPGELVLSAFVRGAFVFAMDIDLASIIAFEALVLAAAIFHHSNLAIPKWLERPLSWIVVTPSIHWVHHHKVRRDTDSNYATVLSIWDRLFGSRSPTQRWPDMPIGVEGRAEERWLALAAKPFKSQKG